MNGRSIRLGLRSREKYGGCMELVEQGNEKVIDLVNGG